MLANTAGITAPDRLMDVSNALYDRVMDVNMRGCFHLTQAVVPAMLVLASQDAPTRTTLCAGAGAFEAAHITLTHGVYVGSGPDADEQLAARLPQVLDRAQDTVPGGGNAQGENELRLARAGH